MSTAQRTKTGCWTCRLRKKKCTEDGPPCSKCHQSGIPCHGYGPRPPWKDRGDREREEARKLRLRSRKHAIGGMDSTTAPTPSADFRQASDASPCPGVTTFESLGEPQTATSPPLLDDDAWAGGISRNTMSGAATPLSLGPDDKLDMAWIGYLSVPRPSHLGIEASEIDILLLVNFMENTFARQYSLDEALSVSQKSWLFCLMLRSPTFFSISLSMSAYHLHLNESTDANARDMALENYQRHRDLAAQSFDGIDPSLPCIYGEPVICGVHLAILEALGNNMRSCRLYLRRVAQFVTDQGHLLDSTLAFLAPDQHSPSAAAPSTGPAATSSPTPDLMHAAPTPYPSAMEHTAAVFFAATFVWNDVLCSAAEKKMPNTANGYRKLLAEEAFSSALKDITGCEAWVLSTVMDITALEISKRNQSAQGNLSVRDLVHRAGKIEGALEQEIARLPSDISPATQHPCGAHGSKSFSRHVIRTRIFGHAALIYLNTVVSGALTGVPEIHQSIVRILPSWETLSTATSPKYLAWAYSTSASLATGSQRHVFRQVMANMSLLDAGAGILREFQHGVEECWKETDKHRSSPANVPCDWREIHKRSNLNFLFV
ncbi:PRO1A C6 Zink-finger protein [Ophiocordyceps sinensis CO18]|nr:PRO1A C6 Zink-finger protein [Ophiocordyceps sinensis CO18]